MASSDLQNSDLKQLAEQLQSGQLTLDDFLANLAVGTESDHADIATARMANVSLDLDRASRCGFPEVVYGEGKSAETIAEIFDRMVAEGIDAFATRVDVEKAKLLTAKFPAARYNEVARTLRLPLNETVRPENAFGRVAVVTAGTSDMPVAEEARETAAWTGAEVTLVQDVGVAGPHRLPERLAELRDADAVVVVAGMEGALPSVAGGYLACPVIGVPTSVGYGANLGGISALLSMLNSCAANVAVVNIDAGFKGGYMAGLIAKQAAAGRAGKCD